jgi:integral membrane sensor domain MASE1
VNRIDISKYNTPLYYAQTLFIAAVYFALGKLSFLDASQNSIITIVIFTAEGFALASAILYGKKVWPGIFIGQFLLAVSMDMQILPAMGIAAVNSVEAVIAVVLFEKFKLNKSLTTKRDVVGLAMLILFVLQIFSALFGNIILLSSSIITGNQFLSSFFSWWFGNSMGQLLVTPFLLYDGIYNDAIVSNRDNRGRHKLLYR